MIDPKELRIGNFIFDDNGIVSKVIGFKPYDHSVRCDEKEGCDIFVDLYPQDRRVREAMLVESTLASPIELSSEWMEKMGFYKEKSNDMEELDIWSIQVANNTSLYFDPKLTGKEWYLSLEWNNNNFQNEFWATPKHIHQVQNLFNALTGEELTIKSFNQSN